MQSSAPTGDRPATTRAETATTWFHWLGTVLLAAVYLLVLATNGQVLDLPGPPGWPEVLLLLLATAATITALARQLALQNVLLAVGIIALLSGAVLSLGVTMSIPFGPFLFGPAAGWKLFKTLPWAVPFIWVVLILNSRGVARLILRPWRKVRNYGFWLLGLSALLTALLDLALDPFATRAKHYWIWLPTKFPASWQGAPLVNFVSWAAVALLILVFITPALINKSPRRRSPDFHPLAIWLGSVLLFGQAAGQHALWPVVGFDGALVVLVTVFALRGGRW